METTINLISSSFNLPMHLLTELVLIIYLGLIVFSIAHLLDSLARLCSALTLAINQTYSSPPSSPPAS